MTEEVIIADGVVFYSDGGAAPNPGYAGYGVHGYFYNNEVPKQGQGLRGWELTNEGYVESLGKLSKVTPLNYVDAWSALPYPNSNNVAELAGAVACLKIALRGEVKEVRIVTDSNYVRKGITEWVDGWVKRNWVKASGEPVPNKDWWVQLLDLETQIRDKGVDVVWAWTKGHDGHIGNENADQLATMGRIAARDDTSASGVDIVPAKGYWSKGRGCNPLLAQTSWYFNTHVGGKRLSNCGRVVYHMTTDAEDDHKGKRVGDLATSVIYLKEPDPVLEMIRTAQDAVDPSTFNWVVIGRLDNILSSGNYAPLLKYGRYRVHRDGRKLDLVDVKKTALTRVQDPPGLAFRAVESLSTLSTILEEYLDGSEVYQVTDLTDQLYDVEIKKKKEVRKLKPSITTSTRVLLVDNVLYRVGKKVETTSIKLTVAIDTARRNMLSAIAGNNPKVKLITWKESDVAFRYATVVETDDDVGIWCGIHSNVHLLVK